MKHISILIPAGDTIVGCIEGPYKVFSEVNRILRSIGKKPVFTVELVAGNPTVVLSGGRISLHPSKTIQQNFKTHLIIIPALYGDVRGQLKLNDDIIDWIKDQRRQGAEVASLCTGAFLLAATGLLNGRRCSTHWMAATEFRRMFPEVELDTDKIVVDDDGLYSSGGAFSYLNLVLYLVEKYTARDIAVLAAKIFQIDLTRESQSPFEIFHGHKEHTDAAVRSVQNFIELHYKEKLTVDQLASMAALSRRNLERRFKKATACTTLEYIQRVKIEAAKLSLERTSVEVADIMNQVGYSDRKAFREVFRKITGLSPLAYRQRYHVAPTPVLETQGRGAMR